MFRPMWSSSDVKIIWRGNCCLLLLLMLLINKFSRCSCVFELVSSVLSCCVLCCISCTYIHTHRYTRTYILWHVNPLLDNTRNTHGPTRNSRTMWLCNTLLGNGSVNTIPRRCNNVTATVGSRDVICAFCKQQPERQLTGWIAITWYMFSVAPYRAAAI
jgi:hypothetical protein